MLPRTDLRTTGASDRRASARLCCPPSAAADEDAPVTEDDKEDTEEEAAEAEVDDGPTVEVDVLAAIDEIEAARAFSRCARTERVKVPDPGSTPSGSEAAISLPYFFFGAIVRA